MVRLIPLDKLSRGSLGLYPALQRFYDDFIQRVLFWGGTLNNKAMGEILVMKSLKAFLAGVCYFGTGIVAVDQFLEGAIKDAVNISPAAQNIILGLLIIFWVVKIWWFIYDKFYLEKRERKLKISMMENEIKEKGQKP